MSDFLPKPQGDFAQWVRLQKSKRTIYAPTLGLIAADVTRLNNEDDTMLAAYDRADAAQAASKSATQARDTLQETYTPARRADIARAKTHAAYTETIGKDCGWVAPETAPRGDDLKPTLKATRTGEGWRFDWSKLGQDYLQLFRRPVGATAWGRYLAIDSRSPYVDTETDLHGAHEYMGQLFHNDQPIGQPSDIVVVVHG